MEEAVNLMEDVIDGAVVGMPHEHLGKVPALFVVAREGTGIGTKDILEHCRGHLSSYKVPFSVHFVDEIPRTGSGKIFRFKLREAVVAPINKAL
jgi:acyl-coenzyme A synthetase/AMP-(fatty) acid ligase